MTLRRNRFDIVDDVARLNVAPLHGDDRAQWRTEHVRETDGIDGDKGSDQRVLDRGGPACVLQVPIVEAKNSRKALADKRANGEVAPIADLAAAATGFPMPSFDDQSKDLELIKRYYYPPQIHGE